MRDGIAFLDIDGVVLPVGALKDVAIDELVKNPWLHLELVTSRVSAAAVAHLQRLAQETPCQFVLISTWRKVFEPDFTQECLQHLSLWSYFHEDWQAQFRFSSTKAHDIADWLGDHRSVRRQDVVVIDDEDLMLKPTGIHQHMPVPNVGFTEADHQAVLEHFRRVMPAQVADRVAPCEKRLRWCGRA